MRPEQCVQCPGTGACVGTSLRDLVFAVQLQHSACCDPLHLKQLVQLMRYVLFWLCSSGMDICMAFSGTIRCMTMTRARQRALCMAITGWQIYLAQDAVRCGRQGQGNGLACKRQCPWQPGPRAKPTQKCYIEQWPDDPEHLPHTQDPTSPLPQPVRVAVWRVIRPALEPVLVGSVSGVPRVWPRRGKCWWCVWLRRPPVMVA